jgi:6-pyruvoyltetrahydropterin/6-carboxytetrahydropterin synthase
MIIRKQYKFEGSHIVRNCSSDHCKQNIHGHSYVVEVFIYSDKLDKGYMAVDFILLEKIKWFIESFDHAYSLWNKESTEFKSFIYNYNRRIAEIPVSPSAEGYALMFFLACDKILENTTFTNGEGNIRLHSVRVHETTTGYAEVFREDMPLIDFSLNEILFSDGISSEWKDNQWFNQLKNQIPFINKKVDLEISE